MTLSSVFTPMASVLPEGERGEAKIKHLVIGPEEASYSMMRFAATGGREPDIQEGTYAQLFVNGSMVMSDTQMEQRTNYEVIHQAKGDVLIAGLGIGLVLLPILAKEEVNHITVIEKSGDAIALVEPHIRRAVGKDASIKLAVIEANIFEWKPPKGQMWDTIYFDIWVGMCTDNLTEMTKLHRKFARRKRKGGWMGSWEQVTLRCWKRRGGSF